MQTSSKTRQSGVTNLEISATQAGQRIDNFLLKHFKGVPKSHIYRLLRSGQVRVNSGRIKPDYKLKSGDLLRIPPIRHNDDEDSQVPESLLTKLANAVVHEDENILCLNKPAGIAVHKGSGLRFGVIEAFRQIRPNQQLELVHRLDRDTSGCLLLAKNRETLNQCHEMLRNERHVRIEKTYIALLHGHWPASEESVETGISKIKRGGEHIMQVDPDGDYALSHFRPLQHYAGASPASLVEIGIETGRTHQIRVHSSYRGHPILGDSRYGDKAANKWHREQGLKRLMLHAKSLYIPLESPLYIEAEADADFSDYVSTLSSLAEQS